MVYLNLYESIEANAQRHADNGSRYASIGLWGYAAGSYRKAERNMQTAARMRDLFEPQSQFEEDMIKAVSADIEGVLFGRS